MTFEPPEDGRPLGPGQTPVRRRILLSHADQLEAGSAPPGVRDHVIRDSLGHTVASTARLFDRSLALGLRRYGVPVGQWSLLLALWARDGASQRVLSELAAIDEATVARTVDRMVRDGLVRRRHSKVDKRQYEIVLTPRGKELKDYLIAEAEGINERARAGLSDQDAALLMTLLAKVRANLEDHVGP